MDSRAPKLLKARMRHTRWFIFIAVPLLIFSNSFISEESNLHELAEFSGYFLVALCVLGRAYCSAYIGGKKNEGVMQAGPYSIVRNPLYVFSFLGILGIGLQSTSISFFVLLCLVFIAYYYVTVRKEEAFLANKFGSVYADYCARVPRWFPKFSLWQEPEEMMTQPYFIRKTMLDASLFFLAFPLFELFDKLQEANIIPTLLIIP